MEATDGCDILKNCNDMPDHMFKLIVIGEASVGKSCLMIRAVKDEYKDGYDVTVGADSSTFMVKIKEKVVQLQIWDTAGMEKFRSVIKVFFTGSHGAFLVYDITRKETYDMLDIWLNFLKENSTPDVKIILVGNKIDLEDKRQVTFEMGRDYAQQRDLFDFVETSAKTGEAVIKTFTRIANTLFKENDKLAAASPDKDEQEADGEADEGSKNTTLEKPKNKKKKGCC